MGLPYVIEYLLSLERVGGGRLVYMGISQTVIPAVPPYDQFVLQVFPFETDYLDIIFASYIDTAVIPEAFYGWGQHFGSRTFEGVFTQGFIDNLIPSLVVVSQSQPALALIENLTALNQYYSGRVFFLTVSSAEDYEEILEALARIGTSAKSEQLAAEANQLLRQLVVVPPPPRPPGGGG